MRDQQTEAQGAEKDKVVDAPPAIEAGEESKTHYHAQGTIPPVGSAEPPAPAASASDLAFGETGGGGRAAAGAAGGGGGGGQPLPDDLRAKFEASLGADLSNVRIHTDGAADAQTKAHGAKATATGQDIHMAPGKYDPASREGQELLAHEVAHTVQQKTAAKAAPKAETPAASSGAEREADGAAKKMLAGEQAQVTPVAEQAPHAKAAEYGDLVTAYRNALNGGLWSDAALRLNGFSNDDLKELVQAMTPGQHAHVREAAEIAMPGWSQRVTDAIDAENGEAAKIATLYAAYDKAVVAARASGDWTEVASRLNGMGDWDIKDRLKKLQGPDIQALHAISTSPRVTSAIETRLKTGHDKPAGITGTPIDAPMVSGSFLGQAINAHPVLLQRLGMTETHLQTLTGKAGDDLRKELGVHEAYKIFRKPPGGYHCFGLAIDINYSSNPYVAGQASGTSAGDKQSMAAIFHACLLTGRGTSVSSPDSWKRSTKETTEELWQHFHDSSEALQAYLMAQNDPGQVDAWIKAGNLSRALVAPPTVTDEARLRSADANAWIEQIKADREATHGTSATQSDWWMTRAGQRTGLGFMDLDKRLVTALRDVGGLGWGAADFGETANGDMQHFDCRNDYSAAELNAALAKLP